MSSSRVDPSPNVLTIGIPTYNRAPKLRRVLALLTQQILSHGLASRVRILVSDNGSADETPAVVTDAIAAAGTVTIEYHRQPKNVGFDGNIVTLYELARTPYLWYFSDDDILFDDAIPRIVDALDLEQPDVLLFSLQQPPGSTQRFFNYPEPVRVLDTRAEVVWATMRCPKVSTYVLRVAPLWDAHWEIIREQSGDGYIFVVLSLCVLEASRAPRVAVISEFLASCDEDFDRLEWTPEPEYRIHRQAQHPLVVSVDPELWKRRQVAGYLSAIQFCFAAKTGTLRVVDMAAYDRFIREIPWRAPILMRNPRALLQVVALKLNGAHLYRSLGFAQLRSALRS